MEESQRIKTFIQYRQRLLRCLLSHLCSKVNLTGFRDAAEAHACQQVTGDLHLANHARDIPTTAQTIICMGRRRLRRVTIRYQRGIHR